MYNRYIRREDGTYTRVSETEPTGQDQGRRTAPTGDTASGDRHAHRSDGPVPGPEAPLSDGGSGGTSPPFGPPPFAGAEGAAGYLRRVLDQLHLDRIDAGDLLLLGLLYFLFREKADEELLMALGLLLIL